ncbi:hypothetical protein H4217_009211, partial [Coemansia sp. RSA 1939]
VNEFGYRVYPHWICQPALRFEHDKDHSKSKRLLNEAQGEPKSSTKTRDNNENDAAEEETECKRQKVAVA